MGQDVFAPGKLAIAADAIAIARNNVARARNETHIALAGYVTGIGDRSMRMFETVTSTMLAIAAQALVVGVVLTTL
jgi:hypothetical protein